MPTNIEIKTALTNRATVEAIAARLSDSGPEIIHQDDFFFRCDMSRCYALKGCLIVHRASSD